MNRRVTIITERRPRVMRLPPHEAAELRAAWSHVFDLTLLYEAHVYRIASRGYIGCVQTSFRTWILRPKYAASVLHPRFVASQGDRDADAWRRECLHYLAERFVHLCDQQSQAGWVKHYAEQQIESKFIQGKIDWVTLNRRPLVVPTLMPQTTDRLSFDHPLHRTILAAASRLTECLAPSDAVSEAVRRCHLQLQEVRAEDCRPVLLTPRTQSYADLLRWCDIILDAVTEHGKASFLFSLQAAFEHFISAKIQELLPEAWEARKQPNIQLLGETALTLRPDAVIFNADGRVKSAWDVKWKHCPKLRPQRADLLQILAYATATGAASVGLIYPGRLFATTTFQLPTGRVKLHIIRYPIVSAAATVPLSFRRLFLGDSS